MCFVSLLFLASPQKYLLYKHNRKKKLREYIHLHACIITWHVGKLNSAVVVNFRIFHINFAQIFLLHCFFNAKRCCVCICSVNVFFFLHIYTVTKGNAKNLWHVLIFSSPYNFSFSYMSCLDLLVCVLIFYF